MTVMSTAMTLWCSGEDGSRLFWDRLNTQVFLRLLGRRVVGSLMLKVRVELLLLRARLAARREACRQALRTELSLTHDHPTRRAPRLVYSDKLCMLWKAEARAEEPAAAAKPESKKRGRPTLASKQLAPGAAVLAASA
ncbi:hypothetical protein GUITHDRAFT_134064 [Guillardia theta CCMP2712]|uniref:Uncharacterized protein n=1 Tax=Guillardia theta (strain CCMP2712) TaxID=905079 RepID=L1JWC5_GUITC|nr:hypothetical protein GUITHDRAFT_134064 [Guillardia theta CCMP2712]EKX52393.1 hypothetical protein GUITHDRAFT_134064 [Guillardia theta CCMP2712]|eukprot:XP_005839373.1 hypothetical protein GUITHDRAFT_134064 [Guillardia theta CCMP2712]